MNLINCCPHPVIIVKEDHSLLTLEKPSRNKICRLIYEPYDLGVTDGIRFFATGEEKVVNLPERTKNTLYVVSNVILSYLKKSNSARMDVVAPAQLMRDDSGAVVGARGLKLS